MPTQLSTPQTSISCPMSGQRRSASASNVPSPAHSIPQRLLISQQPYSASASPPNNQSPSAISRTMAMAFLVFPQRSAFSRLVPQRGGTISLIQHYFKQRVPSSIPHSSAVSSIQHPASSIQHPASSIQHPASSIQHPASSIQHPQQRSATVRAGCQQTLNSRA